MINFVEVPLNLVLSAEEIRHIRYAQFSLLTGISASSFPAWSQGRRLSERTLERIEQRIGTSKVNILHGFELRRQDAAIARAAQAKANRLITFLSLEQESA